MLRSKIKEAGKRLLLQCSLAVLVAELGGCEAGVAAEVTAHKGEVGEIVFVANLLHGFRRVLESCF